MQRISEPLLVDTHLWIWLNEASPEIGRAGNNLIEAAQRTSKVYASVISVWEIAMLVKASRVVLHAPLHDWFSASYADSGIHLLDLTQQIAVEATQLPDEVHRDPADRFLIATARVHGLTLATRDAKLLSYAKRGYLQAVKV